MAFDVVMAIILLAFTIFSEIMVYISNSKSETIIFSISGLITTVIAMIFLFNTRM